MTFQDYLNITAMLIKEEEIRLNKYGDRIHIYFNTNDSSRVSEILGWYDMEVGEPLEAENGTLIFDDYKTLDDKTIYVTVYVKE